MDRPHLHHLLRHLAPAAAAPLLLPAAGAQAKLLDLEPDAPPTAALTQFGAGVEPLGDLDGDGVADFGVLAFGQFSTPQRHVQITSGATRTPIATIIPGVTSGTGLQVAGLGDVDDDGFPDLAVGAPFHDGISDNNGRVIVYSGRSLAPIHVLDAVHDGFEYGASLAGIADINFDGAADLLIGAPGSDFFGTDRGQVDLVSGATGSVVQTFLGPAVGGRFGSEVAVLGDGHFDGLEFSWAAGAPLADRVEVYYGKTHKTSILGEAGSRFGTAITGVDDLDGDGLREMVVGAPEADVFGPFGSSINVGRVATFDVETGGLIQEHFGSSGERRGLDLADALDLDGDGVGELLVAGDGVAFVYDHLWSLPPGGPELLELDLPGMSVIHVAGLDLGTIFGPIPVAAFGIPQAGALLDGEVQLRVLGGPSGNLITRMTTRSHTHFGAATAMMDDVSGDGVPDILVGIPFEDGQGAASGAVEMRSGADGALLYSVDGSPGSQLGTSVANIGDVDGDGLADFAVGAPRGRLFLLHLGRVDIRSGADGSLIADAGGTTINGRFGAAVAGVGDIDGDGVPDVAVGEPWATNNAAWPQPSLRAGRVHVVSGATGLAIWNASVDEPLSYLGTAVAGPGDVDGDGVPDVAVSAPGREGIPSFDQWGTVEVYSSATATPVWTVFGSQKYQRFGASLAVVGDVDGGGASDLAVGSPGWVAGLGSQFGKVEILSGSTGAALLSETGASGERLGAAVAEVGDVDGNGVPDVAVGMPGFKSLLTFATIGGVRVLEGSTGEVVRSYVGSDPAKPLGASLSGGRDLDADGDLDFVAGAPTADGVLEDRGAARVLSHHPLGTDAYGTGSLGCSGAHDLSLSAAAKVGGVADFRCDALQAGVVTVLALSAAPDVAGSDPIGLGVLLHVDFFSLLLTASLPPLTSPPTNEIALPVPADPSLAGFTFYAQEVFVWPSGDCGITFSSSNGLAVTIQP